MKMWPHFANLDNYDRRRQLLSVDKLAAIGQFALFHQLYGRLHIAEVVWEELNARGQHCPGRDEVAAAGWIDRHTVQNQALVTALRRDLDGSEPTGRPRPGAYHPRPAGA